MMKSLTFFYEHGYTGNSVVIAIPMVIDNLNLNEVELLEAEHNIELFQYKNNSWIETERVYIDMKMRQVLSTIQSIASNVIILLYIGEYLFFNNEINVLNSIEHECIKRLDIILMFNNCNEISLLKKPVFNEKIICFSRCNSSINLNENMYFVNGVFEDRITSMWTEQKQEWIININYFISFISVSELSLSQIACCIFSALCSLLLEARPFYKPSIAFKNYFCIDTENNKKDISVKSIPKSFDLTNKTALVFLGENADKYYKYIDYINMNICAVYDNSVSCFVKSYLNKEVFNCMDSIDQILVCNTYHNIDTYIKKDYYSKPTKYIGFGDLNEPFLTLSDYSMSLEEIKLPIIGVVGFGPICGKMLVQLELFRQMTDNGFKPKCITYNSIGSLFGFDVLKYPIKYNSEEMIFLLNSYINLIQTHHENDVAIINIGGGIAYLTPQVNNGCGMLSDVWLKAVPIDYCILCTNTSIPISSILMQINRIKSNGVGEVVIVVRDNSYVNESLSNFSGIVTYLTDSHTINNYIENLKSMMEDVEVFSNDDLYNGKILSHIIKCMS